MVFFFPQVHALIDWGKDYEFLDKELQKVVRNAELGQRLVDKLVKVYLRNGETTHLYIHIEVQAQVDKKFGERLFVYHYRLFDRYNRQIITLAILGDDQEEWRPDSFSYEQGGCRLSFQFPVIKLLDYRKRWKELEQSRNPFSIIVRTHLKGLETRRSPAKRLQWKIRLYKALHKSNYSRVGCVRPPGRNAPQTPKRHEMVSKRKSQLRVRGLFSRMPP